MPKLDTFGIQKNKFDIKFILIIENWMLKYTDNKYIYDYTKLNILLTGFPCLWKQLKHDTDSENEYKMNNITITDANILYFIKKINIPEKIIIITEQLLITNPQLLLKDYLNNVLMRKIKNPYDYLTLFHEELFHKLSLRTEKEKKYII